MKNHKLKTGLIIFLLLVVIIYLIPAPQADFFELYHQKDKYAERLKDFQQRPTKTLLVDGVEWRYYAGGNGDETILFLHGMGGAYDLWWNQVATFESDYRVVSYSLPEEIHSLKVAGEGVIAILDREKVDKFIAVGTSMGGYITQYLLQKFPHRVEKAVLGNTFPPNNLIRGKNDATRKLLPFVPEFIISKLGEKKFNNEILPAAHRSELLKAFLPSLPFSKRQFINRYDIVVDVMTVNPNQYAVKRIPKLIIESDNDPLIEPELRAQLKALYPGAEVQTFHNEGHFPYINAADAYNRVLRAFLKKPNAYQQAENTINRYFEGRKNADVKLLRQAFSPNAMLQTVKDDAILSIPLENYLTVVEKQGKTAVKTAITAGEITQNIGAFKTVFQYRDKSYTDYLTLVKMSDGWKIVNKTFTKDH